MYYISFIAEIYLRKYKLKKMLHLHISNFTTVSYPISVFISRMRDNVIKTPLYCIYVRLLRIQANEITKFTYPAIKKKVNVLPARKQLVILKTICLLKEDYLLLITHYITFLHFLFKRSTVNGHYRVRKRKFI